MAKHRKSYNLATLDFTNRQPVALKWASRLTQLKNISCAKTMLKSLRFLRKHGLKKTVLEIRSVLYWRALRLFSPKYVSSAYGPKFRSNFSDATFGFYIRGSYGYYLADFLKNIDRPFVFLDIGANQGLYSFIAAKNRNCEKVWAFEPVKKTYDLLRENASVNEGIEKISFVNAAISDVTAERIISINPSHTGEASLEHSSNGAVNEKISCISFEPLQEIVSFDDNSKAFLKIDTEGHELVVVGELRKSKFWKKVMFIFFEIDEHWFSGELLIAELEKEGFAEIYRTSYESHHYDVLMKRV